MNKIKTLLQKLLLFLLEKLDMAYTTQQVNTLETLIKNSICRNLNAGLMARTVTYNPNDTRNSITKIVFEINFTNGEIMEISVDFDIAHGLIDVNYIRSTITNLHLLAGVLHDMSYNLRIHENAIIARFLVLIPPAV